MLPQKKFVWPSAFSLFLVNLIFRHFFQRLYCAKKGCLTVRVVLGCSRTQILRDRSSNLSQEEHEGERKASLYRILLFGMTTQLEISLFLSLSLSSLLFSFVGARLKEFSSPFFLFVVSCQLIPQTWVTGTRTLFVHVCLPSVLCSICSLKQVNKNRFGFPLCLFLNSPKNQHEDLSAGFESWPRLPPYRALWNLISLKTMLRRFDWLKCFFFSSDYASYKCWQK